MGRKQSDNLSFLKYAKEFEREIMRINYNRLIPIAIILYFVEWVLFFISYLIFNVGQVVLIFQIFCTILLPFMIFTNKRFEFQTIFKLKAISYLYLFGIFVFCAFIVYTTREQADLLHVFLMALLGVAVIMYMHPKESLFLIAMPAILFILGLNTFHYDAVVIRVYAMNIMIFISAICFLSVNLFALKIKDLHSQKELEEKNKQLEEKSKLDQMTGLYTHTEILDALFKEIERAKRYHSTLSVLLLDIDDFKKLNDRHGHLYGDAVIIELSNIIKSSIRTNDYAGRYGGDEFLILLPSADVAGAEDLYGRLSDALLKYGLEHNEKITMSAGITTFDHENVDDLIRKADNRLYIAKRSQKATCISSDIIGNSAMDERK